MANNLVVQLLLKTGAFSQDLRTAKSQIQNFQSGCQTAGKSIDAFGKAIGINVSALTKLGGAIGAAAIAGKELKAVIDSSQATNDAFTQAIDGAKGAVSAFNTALATFDFSRFRSGLQGIIDDAIRLNKTLDQLGNTQIAFDYMSSENKLDFEKAYNIFKEKKSTDEMKKAAQAQMKTALDAQEEYIKNYGRRIVETYQAQIRNKVGDNIEIKDITIEQFRKAMKIDLGDNPEQERNSYASQYEDYLKKLKEYGKNNLSAQADLKSRYKDVIAIHAMLELMKDEELKGVASMLSGLRNIETEFQRMDERYDKAIKGLDESDGISNTTKEVKALDGTLAKMKEDLAAAKKAMDNAVKDTSSWEKARKKVEELNDEIKAYEAHLDAIKAREKMNADNAAMPLENVPKIAMPDNKVDYKSTMAAPQLKNINYYQDLLKFYTEIRNTIPQGSAALAIFNEKIAETENIIREMSGGAIKESVNSFDNFTSAMSATSTIISNLQNGFSSISEGTENAAAAILQMVASTLPAIGSLIGAFSALAGVEATEKAVNTSKHWIEAIAAVASITAAVAAAISSSKSAGKFANGGIVGGSSFTGDRLTANVNSGEMILNKNQQASLFRQINSGQGGGNQVEFHISGTELLGVLNNNNRKSRLTR